MFGIGYKTQAVELRARDWSKKDACAWLKKKGMKCAGYKIDRTEPIPWHRFRQFSDKKCMEVGTFKVKTKSVNFKGKKRKVMFLKCKKKKS